MIKIKKIKKLKAKKAQEKMLKDKKKKLKSRSVKTQFEEFWEIYDYKKDKGAAIKAFEKAIKVDKADIIIAGAKQCAKHRDSDPKYWKHPPAWLNQQCWHDEYKQVVSDGSGDKPLTEQEKKSRDFWRAKVKLGVKFGINPDRLTQEQIATIILN